MVPVFVFLGSVFKGTFKEVLGSVLGSKTGPKLVQIVPWIAVECLGLPWSA